MVSWLSCKFALWQDVGQDVAVCLVQKIKVENALNGGRLTRASWHCCVLGRVTIAQQSRDQTSETLEANSLDSLLRLKQNVSFLDGD